jgi:hypothetical protein
MRKKHLLSGDALITLPAFSDRVALGCFIPAQSASIFGRSISFLGLMTALLVPAGLLLPAVARAQVTFDWAQRAVGSGFNNADQATAVAVDGSGNVYVADSVNDQLVKIPPGGGESTKLHFSSELSQSRIYNRQVFVAGPKQDRT